MKKVLVTGATGFIGTHIVEELLSNGHSVIATSAHKENAESRDWFKRVDYIPFDLHQYAPEENYFEFFKKPDLLIHLAWEGLPNYKSLFHFEENLPVHYLLIKNMVINGLNDVNVTGTCLEYGMQEGCLEESLPPMPQNPYALAKDTLRKFLDELKKSQPFSFKWIRLFYMYGKGQNQKSLFSQLDRALENGNSVFNMSGGEQVRDYLPVEKVAANIVKIALQQKIEGIVNCCSGHPASVKDLVNDYLLKRGVDICLNPGYYPYPDYEPMSFWGNTNKLKSILNDEEVSVNRKHEYKNNL